MKRIYLNLLTLLFCVSTIHAQNSLKVMPVAAGPGEKSSVVIELENTGKIVGFQFTLTVPQGLVVNEKAAQFTGRKGDHAIYPHKVNNTQYMFICFSMSSEPFDGNSGALVEIPIEVPVTYEPKSIHELSLSGVVLSSPEGIDVGGEHQGGTLTVSDARTPDLEISGITITETEISPNGTISVSWGVKNIGKSEAPGGWREQVSLVSVQTGERYSFGNVNYAGNLAVNENVSRNATFNIPKIVGMDGEVKVEVNMTPGAEIKELEKDRANNKAESTNTATLKKLLYLTFNRTQIEENTASTVSATLTRSGDRSLDQNFQVSATADGQLILPALVTIFKNQSSVAFSFQPVNNTIADGNRTAGISISGNEYPAVLQEIVVIDDEIGTITMTSSKDAVTDGDTITITLQSDIARTQDAVITLTADQANRWTVPASILLPAGEKMVTFKVGIKTLTTPEPTVTAKITAKGEGFNPGAAEVRIESANIPVFEFSIEHDTISKGDGPYATYAVIKRLDKQHIPVTIRLQADLANALILPQDIKFAAGVSQQKFNIGAISNDMVDGTKTVNVTASVYLSSCRCTVAAGEGKTELRQTVTILDDNGLALKVKATPSTVKAGQTNAGKITVSRNTTDLTKAVSVKLTSDMPSVLTIPATAVIPPGKASVDVDINTIIDPGKKGDQTVRIQAEAADYATGFGWILVTDQNKPDIAVTDLSVNSPLAGGSACEAKITVGNVGFTTLGSGARVEYYLSKNTSMQSGTLLATEELTGEIATGAQQEFTHTFQLPDKAGNFYLIAVLNSNLRIDELSSANNQVNAPVQLTPAYTATVSVDKLLYKSEETVTISGTAKMVNNSIAANKNIEIIVRNNSGFSRTYTTMTNETGNYTHTFQPLPGENGHYTVSAGYPEADSKAQVEFDLAGFDWKNKPSSYLLWEVVEFSTKEGEFTLKNNTGVTLTNVRVVLPGNTEFTIAAGSINIPAGETVSLPYSITPAAPTKGRDYVKFPVQLVSDEGARLDVTAWYYCHPQRAKLTANPVSINTTMTKGATRYYEIALINSSVEAKDVKIDIPTMDWMTLVSPQSIPLIAPYDTVMVILQLKPTDKQQINVPLSGNIAVNMSNGAGISIPFKVEPVSEATGTVVVDVVDDYTYNTASAPHLAGANVIIRHPFSGKIIAEGVTGSDGLFTVEDIPEGYYSITISADKHDNYQNNLLVDPGKTNRLTAFLAYRAISYKWDVVPTEVEDEYQIDLIVEFETNVPAPVVVFEYDKAPVDLQPGESKMVNVNITNHGLIRALDVRLQTPTDAEYTFTWMADHFPVLNAKSSIMVPLLIKRNDTELRSSSEGCGDIHIYGEYEVECGLFEYTTTFTGKFSFTGRRPCGGIGMNNGYSDHYSPGSGYNGPGGPGCSSCSSSNSNYQAPEITIEPTCEKCATAFVETVIGAIPIVGDGYGWFQCGFGIGGVINNPSIGGSVTTLADCGSNLIGSIPIIGDVIEGIYSIIDFTLTCITGDGVADHLGNAIGGLFNSAKLRSGNNSFLQLMGDDFYWMSKAQDLWKAKLTLLFKDMDLLQNEDFMLFLTEVADYIDNQKSFSPEEILSLKEKMNNTNIDNDYIEYFCNRWNTSLDAWSKGVLIPNSQYTDIIDKNELDDYAKKGDLIREYVEKRGFSSVEEMFVKDYAELLEYVEKERKNSVCATVTVKFSQTMTMTREAFEGTLTLNNGSDAGTITDVNLDLIVYDENGNDATHLFQINRDNFLSGSGTVDALQSKIGTVIFIPTKQAAPTVPLSYSFGGVLTYVDPSSGEKVTVQLFPVTLEVNPSPDLVLHYFMQRDMLGDDPLTKDVVEPSIPAELALMITNEGYGMAKNVRVESMQPEIIDNEKGLLIDFSIIGSNFNNEPKQLGLLNVNFGNIEPMKSAIGQWWFTSSLLGHFVDYQINVTHLSSFGNKNLSLIKDYRLHELIHSVRAYGEGHDAMNDFLVNDLPDANNTPDRIYYSNGESSEVYTASEATAAQTVSASQLTATLTVTPYLMGWNYGHIDDPGRNQYKLTKVVRNSDELELPLANFWQTFVTIKDGKEPVYENRLHFLDKITEVTAYTLYYVPVDTEYPKVIAFEGVPETMTEQPLVNISVKFNKPITDTTFTTGNLRLIHQGTSVPTGNIVISKTDSVTYSLNVQTETKTSGLYELTVQCAGIRDLLGNEGETGKSISWIQILGELGIISFTTDQVKSQPVNSVEIFFNKPVAQNQLTKEKITLNGQPLGDNVSILTEDNLHYTLIGLSADNNRSGSYELSVNLPAVKSENNVQGLVAQSCKWHVDVVIPAVKYFTPSYQGAVNNQHITAMQVELTKPVVNEFDASWITLYKGSENQHAQLSISEIDSLRYLINGLGEYTNTAGGYKLSVNQSEFTDAFGNTGSGQTDTMWVVNLAKPDAPAGMKITPDKGISDSDNITSGESHSITLNTTADKQTVMLYAVSSQEETLIKEHFAENAGEVNIPVNGYSGNVTFKAIVLDEYGNESDATPFTAFIDNQPLSVEIAKKTDFCSGLTYVSVKFTDDIHAAEFTRDILTLNASGTELSTGNIEIIPVSDNEFRVEKFDNIENNGNITIGINTEMLHKKSSGMQGAGVATQSIGNVSSSEVKVTQLSVTVCQGDSYRFGGEDLTVAGTYRDTLKSVLGCDSILALTLNVNQAYSAPVKATICQGGSYRFGGKDLTVAGTYRDTLKSVLGCDSILALTLNVNQAYYAPVKATICQGGSYRFGGEDLTVAGTYRDTLKSVSGCDSVLVLNLSVSPNPDLNLGNDRTVPFDEPVTLDAGGENMYEYEWSTGEKTQTIIIENTEWKDTISIWVQVSSADNCISNDTIQIIYMESVDTDKNFAESINVFPNPTSGKINISFDHSGRREITLSDMSGKTVYRKEHDEKDVILDFGHLPDATYVLKINSQQFKIIIRH